MLTCGPRPPAVGQGHPSGPPTQWSSFLKLQWHGVKGVQTLSLALESLSDSGGPVQTQKEPVYRESGTFLPPLKLRKDTSFPEFVVTGLETLGVEDLLTERVGRS